MIQIPSKKVERVVEAFSRLPGIGRKTALRLALHILSQDEIDADFLGNSIISMRRDTKTCTTCHNISDSETCDICANPLRNKGILCIVEDVRDFLAIENTGQYTGRYHILGGIISPMDGIGPNDLHINNIENRIEQEKISEIILALPTTIEGDTTCYYIYKKLSHTNVKITTIARGVAIGDELEYTDEITLGRSIIYRHLYDGSSKRSS